jgi:DNA-binding MarR family transcriptional regulator
MSDVVNGGGTSGLRARVVRRHAAELLELFYPIHYRGNMAAEDAMRGDLTRKQAAILWLIRSAGSEDGRCLRRKEIVVRLRDWFDVSSPAVTQALRSMARPPLGLVRLVEDADSGREKKVFLTPKGERFLQTMVERGRDFLQKMVVEQLSEDQVSQGIKFLRAGVEAFERVHANTLKRAKNVGKSPAYTGGGPGLKRTATRTPDSATAVADDRLPVAPEATVN